MTVNVGSERAVCGGQGLAGVSGAAEGVFPQHHASQKAGNSGVLNGDAGWWRARPKSERRGSGRWRKPSCAVKRIPCSGSRPNPCADGPLQRHTLALQLNLLQTASPNPLTVLKLPATLLFWATLAALSCIASMAALSLQLSIMPTASLRLHEKKLYPIEESWPVHVSSRAMER
jgi:hypothetical protein